MRTAIIGWLVLVGLTSLPAGAAAADPAQLVPIKVQQVVLVGESPAVLLVDEPGERYLLMFIDFFMANAIRMGLSGTQLERPLTHDLIGILLRRLGAEVTRITITGLKDNTYYALISVRVNGDTSEFDARPSDALAIAVRAATPIYVDGALLKPLKRDVVPPEAEQPEREDKATRGKT